VPTALKPVVVHEGALMLNELWRPKPAKSTRSATSTLSSAEPKLATEFAVSTTNSNAARCVWGNFTLGERNHGSLVASWNFYLAHPVQWPVARASFQCLALFDRIFTVCHSGCRSLSSVSLPPPICRLVTPLLPCSPPLLFRTCRCSSRYHGLSGAMAQQCGGTWANP
jgi:hypothetical protein